MNLKRLYELQLSKAVPIESLYDDFVLLSHSFRNMDDEVSMISSRLKVLQRSFLLPFSHISFYVFVLIQVVSFLLLNMYMHIVWSLHSVVNSETVTETTLSSLLLKRNKLFEELEYFLNTASGVEEGGKIGNQLACRVRTSFPRYLNFLLSNAVHVFISVFLECCNWI